MSSVPVPAVKSPLPEAYRLVPIHPVDRGTPLRLCVLVRTEPKPVTGHFLLLRDQPDARVYLGCVTDAAGAPRMWVELWVQHLGAVGTEPPLHRDDYCNHLLDRRWIGQARALQSVCAEACLSTGWEEEHPIPMFIQRSKWSLVQPGSGSPEGVWELCRDDAVLQAAQLPAYSSSSCRYLYQPAASPPRRFIPVVDGAPQNAATRPLAEVAGDPASTLPFNPQGGLMMAKEFALFRYDEYVDLLGGKPWNEVIAPKRDWLPESLYAPWAARFQSRDSFLFLGRQGRGGRLAEAFHLKLQLLEEVCRLTRSAIQEQQLPFLNLSSESFRVSLGQAGAGLPVLWTAKPSLVQPAQTEAVPIETTDHRYFARTVAPPALIYQPKKGAGLPQHGHGDVRIRQVFTGQKEGLIVEGTLVLPDRMELAAHDLLHIRIPLFGGRSNLYGLIYAAESLAHGEARFRTLPLQLPGQQAEDLQRAQGVSLPNCSYEVLPLLSSPCDLYSLGVLAVRTFLVNDRNSLPVALDTMLSLAREVGLGPAEGTPWRARLRDLFSSDPRWLPLLGPHHLVHEAMTPEEALALLPAELWYELLGTITRFFPGTGRHSICRDYGDVPRLALEKVFDEPLEDLQNLLVRSRSLIVIDWSSNREISAVISRFAGKGKSSHEDASRAAGGVPGKPGA